MGKNYLQVKRYLEQKMPDLLIDGMHHSPGPTKELIAHVAGIVWTFGLVIMFAGGTIFSSLGVAVPGWFKYVKDNQMAFAVGLFLMNNVAQGLKSTGAFEIYVNGELMHSRLETGAFPTQAALDQLVSNLGAK